MIYLAIALATAAALLAHRWQRGPLTLGFARSLQRLGRWIWSVGDALESAYHHARTLRAQFPLAGDRRSV